VRQRQPSQQRASEQRRSGWRRGAEDLRLAAWTVAWALAAAWVPNCPEDLRLGWAVAGGVRRAAEARTVVAGSGRRWAVAVSAQRPAPVRACWLLRACGCGSGVSASRSRRGGGWTPGLGWAGG
jgi:hypothetical protein